MFLHQHLIAIADLFAMVGAPEPAATLVGATRSTAAAGPDASRRRLDKLSQRLASMLDEDTLGTLIAAGERLTADDAAAVAEAALAAECGT